MTREYKDLVSHIMQYGIDQECRNGSQRIIPHWSFTLDFSGGEETAKLKLRKMYYKGIKGEFNTLIDPEPLTNVSQFEKHGCNYWKAWAAEDGSINIDYHNEMHPQLERLIEDIEIDPNSRRLMLDLWVHNNVYNNYLSLPCCWHNLTFSVIAGTLHMKWTKRSVDTMIGLPSDIYLAYLFMQYVADKTKLNLGTCMFSLSNVHIYKEHFKGAIEILNRTEEDFDKVLKFELKA
jgi:thymidylate synthase